MDLSASGVAAGWDRSAADYERVLDANRRGAERLVASLPPGPYPRVLDVGCGTGFASVAMAERAGARELTGVDTSSEMIERYRERIGALAGVTVRGEVADVLAMPVEKGSFDAVITTMSLHWFPDQAAAVAAMARALRPGGVFATLSSGRGSDAEYRDLLAGLDPPVPAVLVDCYEQMQRDERELEGYLEAAGLEPLDIWMERRRRHLPPERFLARKAATEAAMLEGMEPSRREALAERIGAAVRAAAGPRGFAYTFMKLNAIARRPGD